MAYINLAGGLKINTADAVDSRLVLSKNEMLTMHYDDTRPAVLAGKIFQLPDHYLCVCSDDGKVYLYDSTNEESEETGKFTLFDPQGVALVKVTYSELVALRDAGELIPGQQYRITDYVTTTVQLNTQSAGHQFDIIVTADAVDKLNENARAVKHEGDTYFANSKLEAWKLKYCLDNDTSRFAWADEVNGKGVIYRMIDEFNNDVPYDFKNIRYLTRPGFTYSQFGTNYSFTRDASLDMTIADIQYYGYVGDGRPWSSNTCWLRDDPATTSSVVYDASGATTGYGNIIAVSNENYDVYTFSRTKTATQDFDVSLNGFLYSCYSNTIRPYVVEQAQVLNRITFVGWYTATSYPGLYCYGNTFDDNCRDNTFGYSCSNNTFGSGCDSNTFGNNCSSNTFGSSCKYLQISDNSYIAKKNIHVENGTQGASSVNRFDLYDPAILNKNYQVTFKKSASGKYLMLWATDTGTMTGKVKDSNVDDTWEDIV